MTVDKAFSGLLNWTVIEPFFSLRISSFILVCVAGLMESLNNGNDFSGIKKGLLCF